MHKGITPIVAVVLLLMMTVAAGGVAYIFLSGLQSSGQEATSGQMGKLTASTSSCITVDSVDGQHMYLKNCGTGTIGTDLTVYVDGNKEDYALTPASVDENKVGSLVIKNHFLGGDHSVKISTPGGASTTTIIKGSGYALSFDGAPSPGNDYVDAGNGVSLNIQNAITIEVWAKANTLTSTGDSMVYKPNVWGMDIKSDGAIRSAFYTSARPFQAYDSDVGEVVTGAWYHVAVTYDGANVRIYKNGVQVKSLALTGTIQTSASNLKIGEGYDWNYNFDGSIDEVRILNRALTPDEIKASYERGYAKIDSGVVGLWHFDDGSGCYAYDSSVNNNKGTLGGDCLGTDIPQWVK